MAVEADRVKAHPKTLIKRLCNPFSNFTILVFCYFWTVCGIKCLELLSKALMSERDDFLRFHFVTSYLIEIIFGEAV